MDRIQNRPARYGEVSRGMTQENKQTRNQSVVSVRRARGDVCGIRTRHAEEGDQGGGSRSGGLGLLACHRSFDETMEKEGP